ncbi:WxcM-like domain-containing protein [Patescibacteria group bacterium]|nr:WxcM-like domain-containing protein [Patescibacteria group bacterium]
MHIKNSRLITLPSKADPRGKLGFAEEKSHVPFPIRRVFWVTNVPLESIRGGHAHKKNQQLHICISGSVTFSLDDGRHQEEVVLTSESQALYTGPMLWHWLKDFTPNTVLLVLNSIKYKEEEYIREYVEFLKLVKN